MNSSTVGLLVKQLRFYARFIVTCLLLDRRGMVDTLVEELSNFINEYSTAVRGAGETQEWHLVLQEITLFMQADIPVTYKLGSVDFKAPPRRAIFSSRLAPAARSDPVVAANPLRLQSCVLVGCHQHQVKFSELTLDMYRMMYSLEREPSELSPQSSSIGVSSSSIPAQGAIGSVSGLNTTPRKGGKAALSGNPKKYLLYRPTVSQVLLYLASAQRELQDGGVLMLYISADGEAAKHSAGSGGFGSSTSTPMNSVVPPASPASVSTSSSSVPPSPMFPSAAYAAAASMNSSTSSLPGLLANTSLSSPEPYSYGGVRLKREDHATSIAKASAFVSSAAFYPADIVPFTRKPTFIIVDSDNSYSFLNIGTVFGAPLLVLASPQENPSDVLETSQAGGLLTYYLHDPLAAFLFTSNRSIGNISTFEQAHAKVTAISLAIEELLLASPDLRTPPTLFFLNNFLSNPHRYFLFRDPSSDLEACTTHIADPFCWNCFVPSTEAAVISQFIADPFMRMFLVRFCFAYYALRLRWGKELTSDCLPCSYPSMSPLILGNVAIVTEFRELAKILGVSALYP